MRRPWTAWWDRLSLRKRMVTIAAIAVVVVVTAGAALTVFLARSLLIEAADDLGEARAQQVAEQAANQELPERIPRLDDVEAAVQVVRDGEVVGSTTNATRRAAVPLPEVGPGTDDVVPMGGLDIDDDGPFRVVVRGVETPEGPTTVFVVVDIEDINEVTSALLTAQAVALFVLVVALALVLSAIIGRTLASVEQIRRRAEAINGSPVWQRVPEPARNDEIGRLARTINAMLARLEESSRRETRFVADAAHELRTPLSIVKARLEEEMDRGHHSRHGDALLSDLWEQTSRMALLVDHLLLLARSDSGTVRVRAEPVDLEDLVDEVIASSHLAPGLVRKGRFEPVQVVGDAPLLDLVVRNLLDNATRHAGSTVEVALHADSDRALLTVDDDGPGIPPQHRSEVFDRFVRLDGARARRPGGAGLGLAIVKAVLAAHDGTVGATQSPLGGARFWVSLPTEASPPSGGQDGGRRLTPVDQRSLEVLNGQGRRG